MSTRGHDCRRFFPGLSASLNALHFEPCTANRTICALATQLLHCFHGEFASYCSLIQKETKNGFQIPRNDRHRRCTVIATVLSIKAQDPATPSMPVKSSYQFPVAEEEFSSFFRRISADKPEVRNRQMHVLNERYDLSDRPDPNAKVSRGKPVQVGVRVKLPAGVSWDQLAAMTPEEIRSKGLFPSGFLPLPHPKNEEGGMVFPHFAIEETKKQTGRDLQRFDVDFDIPDHFLPEFPAAMYLTTRPDLGDVSHGQLVTTSNYYELFNGILNPKQLEGLRLLLTPFAQQQFNETADRRSEHPSLGVACLDCHQNGGTNAATHQAGDVRPQEVRHRIDTPALRGVNIQRLFGSQRALKTVEDFTEFEQRAAYFDGDPVIATKKGVNILERGSQVNWPISTGGCDQTVDDLCLVSARQGLPRSPDFDPKLLWRVHVQRHAGSLTIRSTCRLCIRLSV